RHLRGVPSALLATSSGDAAEKLEKSRRASGRQEYGTIGRPQSPLRVRGLDLMTHGVCDYEQPPLAWHPFQLMLSALRENKVRTGQQRSSWRCDEELVGSSLRRDACPHVHGQAGEVQSHALAFTGVDAGADLDAKVMDLLDDLQRTGDRLRRTVENA